MTREIGTDAVISKVRLQHQTSHPSAPASGFGYLYLTTGTANGGLVVQDEVGNKYTFLTGSVSGRVLIQEQTPNGTGTVSFTSIPGTYKKLVVEYYARSNKGATSAPMYYKLNTDATATNYRYAGNSNNQFGAANISANDNTIMPQLSANTSTPASAFSSGIIQIPQYANTSFYKCVFSSHVSLIDAQPYQQQYTVISFWANAAAVTQLDIYVADAFMANTVFSLYGEK